MQRQIASNLRRVMARSGLTLRQVVEATGLCERTVKALLAGRSKPHARTLHALAAGLDISTDELFQDPSLLAHQLFDQRTNSAVEQVVNENPQWFQGWREADFQELYSHFGTGGALTDRGAIDVVQAINRKREIQQKVALLLESQEAELLTDFVELLYQRAVVTQC